MPTCRDVFRDIKFFPCHNLLWSAAVAGSNMGVWICNAHERGQPCWDRVESGGTLSGGLGCDRTADLAHMGDAWLEKPPVWIYVALNPNTIKQVVLLRKTIHSADLDWSVFLTGLHGTSIRSAEPCGEGRIQSGGRHTIPSWLKQRSYWREINPDSHQNNN